jgi:hypothetical protein
MERLKIGNLGKKEKRVEKKTLKIIKSIILRDSQVSTSIKSIILRDLWK